jgi:apolipoprotein N-acyltransferase
VLWPETVINAPYLGTGPQGDAINARFAALASDLGAPLYVGTISVAPAGGLSNVLVTYDPRDPNFATAKRHVTATYGKEQLVPFAEYLPGPAWLRALPLANLISGFTPIRNAVTMVDGATPLICWETNFGDIAFARLREGPSLYLVATDDAWFGTTEGPYEQAQATTLRAVETGRWILRAAATGISGIIAPDGTWTQRTGLGGQAIVIGDVGAPAPGLYTRIGPTPIGVAMALLTIAPFLRRRRTA